MTNPKTMRDGELRGEGFHLKGDFHCHPDQTGTGAGVLTVLEWYRERGYDFLFLTEHRQVLPVDGLSDDRLLVLPGMEMNNADGVVGDFHMLALGVSEHSGLAAQPQSFTAQRAIDLIREAGGLPFIAHPHYFDQTATAIATLERLAGIEVFNWNVHRKLGKGISTETWDQLLTMGHRLWGSADSDNHFPRDVALNPVLGWNVVEVAERTPAAVMEAIRHGHFYASTGPRLEACYLEAGDLILRCSPAQHVYIIADRKWGAAFHAEPDCPLTELTYRLGSRKGTETWVRVEVHDVRGGVAWSNPFFLRGT